MISQKSVGTLKNIFSHTIFYRRYIGYRALQHLSMESSNAHKIHLTQLTVILLLPVWLSVRASDRESIFKIRLGCTLTTTPEPTPLSITGGSVVECASLCLAQECKAAVFDVPGETCQLHMGLVNAIGVVTTLDTGYLIPTGRPSNMSKHSSYHLYIFFSMIILTCCVIQIVVLQQVKDMARNIRKNAIIYFIYLRWFSTERKTLIIMNVMFQG